MGFSDFTIEQFLLKIQVFGSITFKILLADLRELFPPKFTHERLQACFIFLYTHTLSRHQFSMIHNFRNFSPHNFTMCPYSLLFMAIKEYFGPIVDAFKY